MCIIFFLGITGSWEGYVGGANDLYYNGANNAKFSGSTQSSLSLLRFDSNQIYVGSGGNNNVYLKSGNLIIPGTFEPSVRSLRATLPAHRSQIFR